MTYNYKSQKQPKTLKIKLVTIAHILLGVIITLTAQNTLQFNTNAIAAIEAQLSQASNTPIDKNEAYFANMDQFNELGLYDK